MNDTVCLPEGCRYIPPNNACNQIARGTEVFEVRTLLSNVALTAYETDGGGWVGCITTVSGKTDYYQLAEEGSVESILGPLLSAGWMLETCDIDRLTAIIRRTGER